MRRLRQHFPMIYQVATAHGLRPKLVAAMVMVESGGDRWAGRPEPHLVQIWGDQVEQYLDTLGNKVALSNYRNQSAIPWLSSYGLLQVLWPVAYERGYKNPWPWSLSAAFNGLEYGCRHLSWLGGKTENEREMVAAYNGGLGRPNWEYADKVYRTMEELPSDWWA